MNGHPVDGLRPVDLATEVAWHGVVSVEPLPGRGARPWRLPHERASLFPGGDLVARARMPAGVRLVTRTDARTLALRVDADHDCSPLDVVVDGRPWSRQPVDPDRLLTFQGLPTGHKEVQLWLPQFGEMAICDLLMDTWSTAVPVPPTDPRWIAYGSSITQCRGAAGPLDTWPALVARDVGLDLLCLGFGGQCLLDPMVARVIRDAPAEVISLCLGINVYGQATHNERSLLPALLGFISTVRDGHPGVPVIVMSPIVSSEPDEATNDAGLSLGRIRASVAEAVHVLRGAGDRDLLHLDGRLLLGPDDRGRLSDRFHPDGEGYRLMAARFGPVLRSLLRRQ